MAPIVEGVYHLVWAIALSMTRFLDPATVPKCWSYLYFAIAPHLKNHQRSREQCPKWVSTHNRKNDKKCIQQSICYFRQDAARHAALGILPTSMSLTRMDFFLAFPSHRTRNTPCFS
ncbi:hypothetical protein [uncultured Nostoc sp.]|uniref:hypothetical protein n=1 Tax=uncultured Nostoc sp. TaxID=340711 RepID=UPI0035CB5A5E